MDERCAPSNRRDISQQLPKFLFVVVALVLASWGAACQQPPTSDGHSPPPSASTPLADGSEPVPPGVNLALARYFALRPEDVQVERTQSRGDLWWALATVPSYAVTVGETGHRVGVFAMLRRDDDTWRTPFVTAPQSWLDPPMNSDEGGTVASEQGGFVGIGGFLAPTWRAFTVVDPGGVTTSRGDISGGGLLAVAQPGDQLRLSDEQGLAMARPVVQPTRPPAPITDEAAAKATADAFVDAVLSGDLDVAAGEMSDTVKPGEVIPGLARVLEGSARASAARVAPDGYDLDLEGGSRPMTLTLFLTEEEGQPRVVSYNIHAR